MNAVYATRALIGYCSLLRQFSVPLNHPSSGNVHTVVRKLTTDPLLLFGSITFPIMCYGFNGVLIWIFLCRKIVKSCWDVGLCLNYVIKLLKYSVIILLKC
jgi:hypothetical protein